MQIRNWLQCPSSLTHGNIIRREICSKKDIDEVWYMLEGRGIHVVSRDVYRQQPVTRLLLHHHTQGIASLMTQMSHSRLSQGRRVQENP